MELVSGSLKKFWNDEEGLGTLEIILIIAVLIAIALLFREAIIGWVKSLLGFGEKHIGDFDPSNTKPSNP